ncbi:lytic murein transglycosylase [Xanthobacteraceae bacterium Astr-EGSB]|uniref:lytic murein transglycosylase n=1 Tax=Astrobacterium formosum TaxID=3069710 RepID=UPI0027B30E51|nr:lytic murein transglycosylase [Xanthobacteraceae bacterium Astr-EGSB]
MTFGSAVRLLPVLFATLFLWPISTINSRAADAAFTRFLAGVWPDAQARGISRAVFDAAVRGLEPDLSLPDLVLPGRPERPAPGQAEFVQTPADYLKERSFDRLAAHGRKLLAEHRSALTRIEREFGVPATIVLAIWGRETDFGRHKLSRDAVRVLATQAYVGRRKDFFRNEFLAVLGLLQRGVPRNVLKSSWGGALGLTQLLPSEIDKYAVDFDGDGRADIWNSVPDALAAAARQLVAKGWRRGEPWAYEARVPARADCTLADPDAPAPLAEWMRRGFTLAHGRVARAEERAQPASLLLPAGIYGPGFLIFANYYVIKEYNFSDLYVLFVGHLADRIEGERSFERPWDAVTQLRTAELEDMQRRLSALGLYTDKIDGKAGMKTRLAVGAYQKANGLTLDCWPTAATLGHLRGRTGR